MTTTKTPTAFRVTYKLAGFNGGNHGTIRVEAPTREEAAEKALEVAHAASAKRAAIVKASGGPVWAQTPNTFEVASIRKAPARRA
jgi:hypothetical protein